jgi:hypothetical protein
MVGRRLACYARATSGHAAAAPPQQRDELASHSITSSAMLSSDGGRVRANIRAVCALITSWNRWLHDRQLHGLRAFQDATSAP